MKIHKSYMFRMYPNHTQEVLLAKTFGCNRFIWNKCVEAFESYDKVKNPSPKAPTKKDLESEFPWLNEVSAASLQQKNERLRGIQKAIF